MDFIVEEIREGHGYDIDKVYTLKDIDEALKRQAKEIHDVLDNLNGEKGNLCLYCNSKHYNGKVGIMHDKGCIILKLREISGKV